MSSQIDPQKKEKRDKREKEHFSQPEPSRLCFRHGSMVTSGKHRHINSLPPVKTSQEERPDHMSNDFRLPEPSPSETSRISGPLHSVHFIDEYEGITVHKRGEHRKNFWGTQLLHASDQLGKGGSGREQDS